MNIEGVHPGRGECGGLEDGGVNVEGVNMEGVQPFCSMGVHPGCTPVNRMAHASENITFTAIPC